MARRKTRPADQTDENVRALAEVSRLARMATAGVVPEAIRRCRRLATHHRATSFVLFFTGRGTGSAKLVSSFDEAFPGTSRVTTAIIAAGAEILSRHAAVSAVPLAWGDDDRPDGSSPYVDRIAQRLTPVTGIAFPVSAESGQTGLFVFTGPDLNPDVDAVAALHLDCHGIFASMAALRTGSASSSSTFTNREIDCLKLTAAGLTSEDIARILGLSIHTANQYLTTAGAKLDAVNRVQAVAKALRLGVID